MLKVVTVDGCLPCEELKEMTKELVEAGEMEFIDGMSDEGQRILEENKGKITHVPFVFLEEEGGIRGCEVKYEEEGIVFDCEALLSGQ